MKNPRTTTKVFSMLECFAQFGAMNVEEIIEKMGNISHKATLTGMNRILKDAVEQDYIEFRNGRYQLTEQIESFVLDVMEMRDKHPKEQGIPAAYRNIWTPELKNYTASLYQNKRGY